MANTINGSIVSDLRGRVGSEVYSRNKYGSYVKTHTDPVQPNTDAQLDARSDWQTAISAWQALSDAERTAWINYARENPAPNRMGVYSARAGYNMFVARKMNLLQVGRSNDPQPLLGNPAQGFSVSFFELTEETMRLQIVTDASLNDFLVSTYMSPPVSPGVMSPNSVRYDRINFLEFNSTTTSSIDHRYTEKFGSMMGTAGKKIFLKCMLIQIKAVDSASNMVPFTGRGFAKEFHDVAVIQSP